MGKHANRKPKLRKSRLTVRCSDGVVRAVTTWPKRKAKKDGTPGDPIIGMMVNGVAV